MREVGFGGAEAHGRHRNALRDMIGEVFRPPLGERLGVKTDCGRSEEFIGQRDY
jgi:hypothetical protein